MSDPFDPTQAGGVPTPPAGNPSVGGTGGGAPVPPDAPPTVAAPSVYAEPPTTAYGAGPVGPAGPGGPGGPGDEDAWGPDDQEPSDDRWKIYVLVGLAVVVIALLIGGIILSQSGDEDDGGDTTTSSSSTSSSTTSSSTSTSTTSTSTSTTSSTTTTTAPTTTTAAGPAGAASPEAAAASLFNAWTAGDEANAGQFADPGAVQTLFSRDGVGNDLSFDGCDAAGGGFDCTYSNDSEIVLFTVDPVPSGFRVTGVSFPND